MTDKETAAARILRELQRTAGPVCDDCLPARAALSRRQHANAEARRLQQQEKISRTPGLCGLCGGLKLVNRIASAVLADLPAAPARASPASPGTGAPVNDMAKRAALAANLSGSGELRVLDFSFKHVSTIRPECDDSGEVQRFYPHLHYRDAGTAALNKYGAGPFCRFGIPRHLALEGVYLLAAGSEIRYVGKCDHLSVRFNTGYGRIAPRNCYQGGQNTNCKVNRLILSEVEQGRKLDLWFYQTADPLTVEKQLIAALRPPWNGRL